MTIRLHRVHINAQFLGYEPCRLHAAIEIARTVLVEHLVQPHRAPHDRHLLCELLTHVLRDDRLHSEHSIASVVRERVRQMVEISHTDPSFNVQSITSSLNISRRHLYRQFESSQRKDWDGVGWTLDLLMQPREQDTILVRGSRAPEETTLQGDFIKRESLEAAWTHDWNDRIFTELGTLIGRDTYEQSFDDREDDIYNVSFRVGYEIRRWANFYTGYSYDEKDSNAEDLSYTENVFNIGVDLSL